MVELRRGGLIEAADILMAGAQEIKEIDPRKALAMLLEVREAAGWAGDTPRTVAVRHVATSLPRGLDDETDFLIDLLDCIGRLYEGETTTAGPLVLDVLERAETLDDPRLLVWASTLATAVADEERESALLQRGIRRARETGAIDVLMNVLLVQALTRMISGRLTEVSEVQEGYALAVEAGYPTAASTQLALLAWFAAVTGDEDRALRYASEAAATAPPDVPAVTIADWGVGILELSRRRYADAASRLQHVVEHGHPYFAAIAIPDLVEAYVGAGRREDAIPHVELYANVFASEGAPSWAHALTARSRAIVAEAPAETEAAFLESLRHHEANERVLDRARTELLFGEFLRRERRRMDARAQLRSAQERFDRLGASQWAERAASELRATGETARRRQPDAIAELTPQEQQIAKLVAEGGTNKEIAAQLFLSPRTVEYHLRKVFMKLGITSRAELIRRGLAAAANES
jgi:DNA-binding CsgD family transcriptional regulator